MSRKFDVIFLEEAMAFLDKLNEKARDKIIYNIDKTTYLNDPKLFKRLNEDIWEFRTLHNKTQYRILAFWDKEDDTETLVLTTHGFIKKSQKTPSNEIQRAQNIRRAYFAEKGPII